MTKEMFLKSVLPIGVFFSGSLIFGNMAYLYLSVSYIQMLKVNPPLPPSASRCLFNQRHSRQLRSSSSRGPSKSQNPIVNSG
jgi:hypothetical protein